MPAPARRGRCRAAPADRTGVESIPWNEDVKQAYGNIKPRGFQEKTLHRIAQANEILEEYAAQGFVMTVRQLFYQFVARGLIENNFNNYKRLTVIIDDARQAGLIDWDHLEDRTRALRIYPSWKGPEAFLLSVVRRYREDLWEGQDYRPEVWIEKAALLGVIEPICNEYRVPHFPTIGNTSQSEMREAGERYRGYLERGLIPVPLHLVDHDPNGIDMTRDLIRRLELFAGEEIEVRRVALNMDQVREYNPPANFAKELDNNKAAYVEQFGTEECWELDALAPPVIEALIRAELEELIDFDEWNERKEAEEKNRKLLAKVARNWPAVEAMIEDIDDEEEDEDE
jgi:hypothetical protein